MVKIDRIEHNVTIPEGVTATLSEDGVVTIAGPNGSLSRASSHLELRSSKMEADSSYERTCHDAKTRLWQEPGTLT